MQPNDVVPAVMRHPKYQELLRKRSRISMTFFIITLVLYSGFVLTLAFDPVLFGQPIAPGYTLSIGVVSGVVMCIIAVVLIAVYVSISNRVFDPLIEAIVKDVS